jgi:hypothetical protein
MRGSYGLPSSHSCNPTKPFLLRAGLIRGLCWCGNRVPGSEKGLPKCAWFGLAGGGMTAPVRVKLSRPSFGRGMGLKWSVLRPGAAHQLCCWGPVSPSSQAHLPPTPVPTPSTARRGRQLSSINRLQQPSSTSAFLTKPSLPTTIHSTLPLAPASSSSGTRTLELSFRLASSPVLLHATHLQSPPPNVPPRSCRRCSWHPSHIHSTPSLDLSPIRQPCKH